MKNIASAFPPTYRHVLSRRFDHIPTIVRLVPPPI
jgi:hypothetical protein